VDRELRIERTSDVRRAKRPFDKLRVALSRSKGEAASAKRDRARSARKKRAEAEAPRAPKNAGCRSYALAVERATGVRRAKGEAASAKRA
jgi:hypothetical protein